MIDASEIVRAVKRLSLGAAEAGRPVEVCFGRITEVKPLRITAEQRLSLGESQLILCRNVCDFSISLDGKTVRVNNGLSVGEQVVMLRQQGGQRYIVWDRIG